jgi:hypothetical protein
MIHNGPRFSPLEIAVLTFFIAASLMMPVLDWIFS